MRVGNAVEADLTLINFEVLKDESGVKDGKPTSTKKAGPFEADGNSDGVKKTGMQMENSAGFQFLGMGGKIGQKQTIGGENSDYTKFTESGAGFGSISSTIIEETDANYNTTTRQESSFTVGAKFILGVELNFKIKQ